MDLRDFFGFVLNCWIIILPVHNILRPSHDQMREADGLQVKYYFLI